MKKCASWFTLAMAFLSIPFLSSMCEAKSYKVIVGYENEEMEVPLSPGRKIPPNSEMPTPGSTQLNSEFPPPTPAQTIVPPAIPSPTPTAREPVDFATPRKSGFGLPPGFGIPSAQDLQASLESSRRVTIYGITFDLESATITPSSIPAMEAILEYLKDNPGVRITIEGHCDALGDPAYNLGLSQRRAESVRDWLVGRGANGSNLSAVGRGETQPIADNSTPEGRAMNRRVDLVKG